MKALNIYFFSLLTIGAILLASCTSKKEDMAKQTLQEQSATRTDTLIAHDSVKTRCFALKSDKSLFEFNDGDKLPEDIEEIYTVITDLNSKPLCFTNVPVSQSGDWYIESTYYFDKNGKTVFYRYYLGSFNSECTDVLRAYKDFVFDSNFNLLSKKEYFKDKGMHSFNPVNCQVFYPQEAVYDGFNSFDNILTKFGIKLNR